MPDPGLRRLALGTLLAAFPGPDVPEWIAGLLADGLAGVTLFGSNTADPVRLPALTTTLRSVRSGVLIAADEEGGDVTRLDVRTGSGYPGNLALGRVDDPALTRDVYAAIGADLAAAGITLGLAPVADVNTAADNPVIGTRAFGADPLLVARHTAAAVTGLQGAGVAACVKHFPGHGATTVDSHLALPTVDAPPGLLRRRDLPPFAAAIDAGALAIMTAHIRVPSLTGTRPATFSPEALQDLLRSEYAFRGAIVTDALEMRGATALAGGLGAAAVASLAAGADVLCLGARVDAGLVEHVLASILGALDGGQLTRARLEEAATRTAALAAPPALTARPGGGPPSDDIGLSAASAGNTGLAAASAGDIGLAAAPAGDIGLAAAPAGDIGFSAARRALLVEGDPAGFSAALLVRVFSGRTVAEGPVPWGLAVGDRAELVVAAGATVPAELAARAGGRPIVLAGRRLHRDAETRGFVEELAARCPVAVVEMGWPSAWRPAGARAFLTTFGAGRANARAAASALGLPG